MKRIEELEQLIRYHKELYYSGISELDDIDYDKLELELRSLDPQNNILNLVGSEVKSNIKIKHDSKMLSLLKTYDLEELIKWAHGLDIIGTFKLDGVSCSLIYENQRLILAKTRGNGQYGENITNKVMWMNGVPQQILSKNRTEIRGEIFCTQKNFLDLSKKMEEIGLEIPTSPRNIVAGLIGRKENLELNKYISLKAFEVIGPTFTQEIEKYHFLKENKFSTLEIKSLLKKEDFILLIERAKDFMQNGDFQIDGLVFIYNKLSLHKELGETAHHPRYKMAFKFEGEKKTTLLKKIKWQVSRNGLLTPVGEIEPIEISGAKVSRVTLHNYGVVRDHNLKSGDIIEIIRSGEVIPKFLRTLEQSSHKFLIPDYCPSCKEKLEVCEIRIICRNKLCYEQIKETILHFIQKIGIDNLSSKRLDEMLKDKLVARIEDLYKLDVKRLMLLDKVKEKLASKLITSINKSKEVDLVTFLVSLGLAGGAYNKCEKIVKHGFNTMTKILALDKESLSDIEGFAEKSASDLVDSLRAKEELIRNLMSLGFDLKYSSEEGLCFGEMKICITGSLSKKRNWIEEKIRENGGSIVSSVTSKTNILLTNDAEGSSTKFKKAKELGIKIISEEDLHKMIVGDKFKG